MFAECFNSSTCITIFSMFHNVLIHVREGKQHLDSMIAPPWRPPPNRGNTRVLVYWEDAGNPRGYINQPARAGWNLLPSARAGTDHAGRDTGKLQPLRSYHKTQRQDQQPES